MSVSIYKKMLRTLYTKGGSFSESFIIDIVVSDRMAALNLVSSGVFSQTDDWDTTGNVGENVTNICLLEVNLVLKTFLFYSQ